MATLSSKERVLTALANREADRVPVDYLANPEIDRRLKEHYGLKADDDEGLRRALGVDVRSVGAPYRGPKLHAGVPERDVIADDWGIHRRWIEHGAGGYWDVRDFPLRDATVEQVAAWALPNPDDFDYSGVAAACRANREYAVGVGGAGHGDVINATGMVRSMEAGTVSPRPTSSRTIPPRRTCWRCTTAPGGTGPIARPGQDSPPAERPGDPFPPRWRRREPQ